MLNVSKQFDVTPSRVLAIEDEYTAYCLDEACAYILTCIDNGKKPSFDQHYSSFSELYKNI